MTEEEISETVDRLAEEVIDEAKVLGITPLVLVQRIVNEVTLLAEYE